ncbi:hypothetical protein L596_022052 [Steinernema carpocapsae]|nr:hypothetical protein L596_022052 [Steinernema carpocapsae]
MDPAQPPDASRRVVELESEISMSLATDDTRTFRAEESQLRRASQPNGLGGTHHDVAMSTSAVSSNESKSFLRRLSINVEPAIFLFSVVLMIMIVNTNVYLYWARCNQLYEADADAPDWKGDGNTTKNATAVCANLSHKNYTKFQDKVERDIASMKIWLQVATSIPSIITAPLIGMWSDGSGGRRIPLLISLLGLLLYSIFYLGSSLSYTWLNVYYVMFVAEFTQGMMGGFPTLFSSALAIITDESRLSHTLESSTISFKICCSAAIQQMGLVVGTLIISLSSRPIELGILQHANGYIYAYATGAVIALTAFLYALLFVRETHKVPYPLQSSLISSVQPISALSGASSVGFLKTAKAFLYDLLEVVVARRPGWTRFCMNLSVIFVFHRDHFYR